MVENNTRCKHLCPTDILPVFGSCLKGIAESLLGLTTNIFVEWLVKVEQPPIHQSQNDIREYNLADGGSLKDGLMAWMGCHLFPLRRLENKVSLGSVICHLNQRNSSLLCQLGSAFYKLLVRPFVSKSRNRDQKRE